MAGNKTKLQQDIKTILTELAGYDGSDGQKQSDAIDKFSQDLSNAISSYVLTLTIQATPAQVTSAVMVAGGSYPVVATNSLDSKVMEV